MESGIVRDRVREVCLALPDTSERLSHGEPAWFVGGRQFANFADHHHDDRVAVWCAAPEGAQESLVETAPDRFFRPPYVGQHGWVGAWIDRDDVDGRHLASLVDEAYRMTAPKRLVRTLGS